MAYDLDDVMDAINRGFEASAQTGIDRSDYSWLTPEPVGDCGTSFCPGGKEFRCNNCGEMMKICPCGVWGEMCCEEPDLPHEACVYNHWMRPYPLECQHTKEGVER